MANKQFYYVVKVGRNPGIYTDWTTCSAQVQGFTGAVYKKFTTKKEAEAFLQGNSLPPTSNGKKSNQKYYAVRQGHVPGIYPDWMSCSQQVAGYPKPIYKKFDTLEAAQAFLEGADSSTAQFKELPNTYYAYVDGSYINGKYGWGMVIYYNGEVVMEAKGSGADPDSAALHNVAGEVLGAMEAAKWAYAQDQPIILCHDYNGIAHWALGQWKRNKALTQAYYEFMQNYLPLIKFQKIAGHTGVKGNERADILAKQAVGLA